MADVVVKDVAPITVAFRRKIGPLYTDLFTWIEAHGYRPAGPVREAYVVGRGGGKGPNEFVTEVQVPVAM